MLMNTSKLLVLRLYNVTFGRSAAFDKLLRRALVKILIQNRNRGEKYVASSRFFDINELDRHAE